MPKMTPEMAAQVDEAAQSDDFTRVIEEGLYAAVLTGCKAGESSQKKTPLWTWTFEIPEGFPHAGKRLFNDTYLTPASLGMPGGQKQTFAALGVPPSTDTDEVLGTPVMLDVRVESYKNKAGNDAQRNIIANVLPYEYNDGSDTNATAVPAEDEPPF